MDKRTVYLVDDEEAVRSSVGFLLKVEGYAAIAYASGVELLAAVGKLQPGCILLDIRMPRMDGLEVQRALSKRGVAFPVVMLTGHGDISLAVRAIKAGAIEFLEKPFEKAVLLRAIDAAFEWLGNSRQSALDAAEARVRLAGLTPRERDVLDGLVSGHSNKITAFNLGVSTRTVEIHRANLMHKLGVNSLSAVLRLAFAAEIRATTL